MASGIAQLDRPLTYYHYGAANSTASYYGGIVDIRGEVMLLSRNVKIVGNDSDAWGCQIVTSDYYDWTGNFYMGSTYLDNVEIYNCSQ